MARLISTMRGAALALALLVAQAAAQCPGLNNQFATTMGAGYENQLIANGLRSPRGMVFDKEDNLLVIEQGGGGLRQIKLNADGCVTSSKTIISDSSLNHGVDISADGKTVFVSSLESVFAYDYDAAAGTATGKKVIISNMRNGGHSTRTLLRSRTDPDILLVSRGSNANIDSATTDPASGRSLIRMYSIAEITKTAVDMATGGKLLGYGLRNSVAVGENPVTGEVYSAENSIDNAMRFGKDVHNTQPAEEMNYHGRINDTSNPLLGANYGYPTCVAAYEPVDQLGNPELQVGSHFAPNTAAGDAVDAVCEGMQEPRLVFPAHNAPLDLKFDPTGRAAYIAFHGSWNRSPPDGYRLMKVEFGEDGQPVQPANSTNAAVSVMANTNLAVCPGQCFRPTGLAFDSKGRLFMSSDSSGQIFLIKGT